MNNQQQRDEVGFIWRITDDVLRDAFKKNEIGDVLLPFVLIRRMDCLLEPVNDAVRAQFEQFRDKIAEEKLVPVLRKAAGGLQFYNTSQHTLHTLQDEPQYIEINFNNYLHGFNPEVRDILENFQFDKVVARLVKNRLLYQMIGAICQVDLHPNQVDNHGMGYVFEELIRIANEQSNETAGEHFTPRDVVRLMNALVFGPDREALRQPGLIRTIYDPAMGTGGLVNLGKTHVLDVLCADLPPAQKPEIKTHGQELNEQSYAIAKAEALITGEDTQNITQGNSFTEDHFPNKQFHYMLANPPYGVTWKRDKTFITAESLNPAGRFYAGLPRISDGQLLFVQHMLSKMVAPKAGGSRLGVVTNGSPLFSGDAGSGESDIRRWIIENDWLEGIIALPKDLFYNTGINTYIWVLTNHKAPHRQGKVQLFNANAEDFYQGNKRSLGNKRNELTNEHIAAIAQHYQAFEEDSHSKIFANEAFGYYQLTIEQPQYNESGQKLTDKKGNPKPDSKKRDKENVPMGTDIDAYFAAEVQPHVPEAWIDYNKTKIGYQINFTRYFYQYQPLEPAAKIKEDIVALEKDIATLLKELLSK